MPIFDSISSFFDDLTTSRRHATKTRTGRSTSPSNLPFYTNGHPQSSSTNNLPSSRQGLSPITEARQRSWDAPNPSMRSTSAPALRIPSAPFIPHDLTVPTHRKGPLGIQLQELSPNGVQPPPPVADSWARIDTWAENHYPELFDQLSFPATSEDVDFLESELDCTLPMDVRQSLYVHDGQDRGGKPTGILFGVTLLDCEEIVEEWQLWKTVAQAYVHETSILSSSSPREESRPPAQRQNSLPPTIPETDTPIPCTSTSTSTPDDPGAITPTSTTAQKAKRRQSKIFGQTARFTHCRPPDTIQRVYAHPAWIPLAKDYNGNNIAVDLCPGPRGTWGQIILFGRDCETKYVVARSWASFLAAVAEDFEGGEARFVESADPGASEQLRIRPCLGARDDTFIEVLKGRVRLREREIRRKRETMAAQQKGRPNGVVKDRGGGGAKSPIVDLIANSPILNGDGIPSPNLSRSGDSIAGSPVIGTPTVAQQQINGTVIDGKEEITTAKGNRGGADKDVIATPTPTKAQDENDAIITQGTQGGTEMAVTKLGTESGRVVNGDVT